MNQSLGKARLRSRQQIIVDILETALLGAERRKIILQAKVNYRQFREVVNSLLARGLITATESPDGKIILKTTSKGHMYVETYRSMMGQQGAIISSQP